MPASADLAKVNEVLHGVCEAATSDPQLKDLLLETPRVKGVESIRLDTVNLQMVARTLPGKQFEVSRRLRTLVLAALSRAGIVTTVAGTSGVES